MIMETVDSHLISERGHDAEKNLLHIRFRMKSGHPGPVYEYGNVTQQTYLEGRNYLHPKTLEHSFGSWFTTVIKANPKQYPYRQIQDASIPTTADGFDSKLAAANDDTTDFASGQPIPATTPEDLPEDVEVLKVKALALKVEAEAITIDSPDRYSLGMTTGSAIAKMQDALKKAMYEGEDGITARHRKHREAMEVFNFFNEPLERIKLKLKASLVSYQQEQKRLAEESARVARESAQREEDEKARQQSDQLKLDDALEAEARGEHEVAQQILDMPALPMAPAIAPPVFMEPPVPQSRAGKHTPKWVFEYVDRNGKVIEHPDLSLIPIEYHVVNESALKAAAKTLNVRAAIPGIRVYDVGNVSFSKKG